MTPRDEPPRDPWLSEALRHAPDAGALPPAELSETILRQARDAVSAAPARAPANPLMHLWSWLARPPVAAGFATLTMATLIGVMWWDKPLEDTLPRAGAPAAATDNTVAKPVPAPVAAPAPAPLSEPARDESKAAASAEKEAPRSTAKRAAAAPPPPSPLKREQAAEERTRAVDAAAPAITNPAAPGGALADRAANPSPAPERLPESRSAPAPAPAPAPATAPAQALGKVAPAAGLSLRRHEADATTPLAEQAERWTWQRGGREQAMTPALQRWLVQLDRAARWRLADTATPAATDSALLHLAFDGKPYATIQLGDEAVWLTRAGDAPLTASLSPATAATLKAALFDAAP